MLGSEWAVGNKGFVDRWGVWVKSVRLDLTDWFGCRVFAEVIGSLSSFRTGGLLVD